MHVTVVKAGKKENEYHFRTGPIYIGRQIGSQIFLQDRAVSRQHAVFFTDKKNRWYIEDLDSPNKTYLNRKAIHKSPVNGGDVVEIAGFKLKVSVDEGVDRGTPLHLDDTLTHDDSGQIETLFKNIRKKECGSLRLDREKLEDLRCLFQAAILSQNEEDFCRRIVRLLLNQMNAQNVWVAAMNEAGNDIVYQFGQCISTQKISFDDIFLKDQIHQAINDGICILVPKLPISMRSVGIKSAIVIPVLKDKKTVGLLYVDNSRSHESYEYADLDYLIIASTIISTKLDSFR